MTRQPPLRNHDSWEHQLDAYEFAASRRAAMLAMDMGTGKSKVLVDLFVNEGHQTGLILCPLSVLGVWRREFQAHAGAPVAVYVIEGSKSAAEKAKDAKLFIDSCLAQKHPAIIVVNYETCRTKAFMQFAAGRTWDMTALDESHRAKGPDTATGKCAAVLGNLSKRKLCLTGTPMPHSPLDAFSQFRFLDPNIFGLSYHRFRYRYAVMNRMFPSKVDAWRNMSDFQERFARLAFRVDSSVLDLPPVVDQFIPVPLTGDALRVYHEMRDDAIAEYASGIITASNALVKLLRLQQVTSGFTVDDADFVHEVGIEKQRALKDLISDIDPQHPIVVFCRFVHDLRSIKKVAAKLERTYGEISGSRKDLTDESTMPEGIQVMGVQIQAGGVGIDLTRARYACYYSMSFAMGDYMQSRARVHRPGQMHPVTYYHLTCPGTIDEVVYGVMKSRGDLVGALLDSLKEGE